MYEAFCERYSDVADFADASEEELATLLLPLGLRWRIPLLRRLARELASTETVDGDQRQLESLPAVGPYAAAATLSLHASKRAVIIDSNVVRVLCRVVGRHWNGETRRERWLRDLADRLTPRRVFKDYNYGLLDLAMTLCRPQRPDCVNCPLRGGCASAKPECA